MLSGVFRAVGSEELATAIWARGVVRDRIEFMVPHDDLGASAVDHLLHDFQDRQLIIATIDEVADEDGVPIRMPVGTRRVALAIAKTSSRSIRGAAHPCTSPMMS